jgi:hypothetical protein
LFLLRPAGGIGIRACLRSTIFRVRIPGGVPDFFVRERSALACSFTTWMWQTTPRRACSEPIGRAAGRRVPVVSSRCSAAGQRASFGTTRPQVRVLPARPYPCSSVARRARRYERRGREFDSLQGFHSGRRNSERRVLACRARSRGFKSRRRRQSLRRVTQWPE